MGIYRVMVTGTNIFLEKEGKKEKSGFVRNEYVWTSCEATAIKKAKRNITKLISRKNGVSLREGSSIVFEVDIVESGYSIKSLLGNEGFIFFEDV